MSKFRIWFAVVLLFLGASARADTAGSISGTVRDATGGVVPGIAVTARSVDTAIQRTTKTNADGFYAFPALPLGHYDVEISPAGFKPYTRTGLIVDVNTKLQVDVTLEVGEQSDQITISDSAVHVETETAQMGEVIDDAKMIAIPLNGRSFTDLLNIQPGVVPVSSQAPNSVIMAGVSSTPPSGDANPGNMSISGERETANGFIVNGSDVEEDINMGVAILPNLDSIDEFRILTNNFDAEYGNFSGGQILVETKSGTNSFHGDAFEFLRNTAFDAKNYFSPQRAEFDQNQFGGTFGGPVRPIKIFFFSDYQGTRMTEGVETGVISVPSLQDRNGNLSDLVSGNPDLFTTSNLVSGEEVTAPTTVSSQNLAAMLTSELGHPVSVGEAYYTPSCTPCVFPGAVIPKSAWSAPAKALLPYIPAPNFGTNSFYTSAYNEAVRDDKGAVRLDGNTTRWGNLSAYYFADDYDLNSPYPQGQGGANVPSGLGGAFNALSAGRAQLVSLGGSRSFGANAVNEFHFSYMRDSNTIGTPQGGVGVPLACQGFVTAVDERQKCPGSTFNSTGIYPLDPAIEGIENVALEGMGFTFGTDITGLVQHNNTFQWIDNYSKIIGTHSLKFGAEFHLDQVNSTPNATFNGSFQFNGTETGSDFADFLLGTATAYVQAEQGNFYARNRYIGLFGQDSWRIKAALTLNFGMRWDVIPPWSEKYNQLETFVPGQQSVVFPGAPPGFLFPGDPGVPATLSPVQYHNFSPRIGLAYSPNFGQGWLGRIFGGPGKTSVRAGYGMFYTAFEGLSASIMYTIPPYGYNFVPSSVLFATPTIQTNGTNLGQPFPAVLATFGASASHPNATLNWSALESIEGDPALANDNRVPYAEHFNLSIERQFASNTLLSISYVGSQGHRLLVVEESNPGNPQLCLQLGPSACGPGDVDASRPYWPYFGGNTLQKTVGNSNYNALEVNLRHTSKRAELLIGYTYSKSIDDSSNLGEAVDPFNLGYTRAISAFDMKHNFVATYRYDLPFAQLFHRQNEMTRGWSLSGTTRFCTGLPVTLFNNSDTSLLGTNPNGVNNNYLDEPNFTPGALEINTNPRNASLAFNTSLFHLPALGDLGNSPRRFFLRSRNQQL